MNEKDRVMIDKAIGCITDEMMKLDCPVANGIEEYLTDICTNAFIAEKLVAKGKSLKEIHKKVWDEAKNRKKGNSAYIPQKEVFTMVREYYEITDVELNGGSVDYDVSPDEIDLLDLV